MQLRRILVMAAVGAILIWIFFGRPIYRRMQYADVIRRASEDKCCGPGYARYPTLCPPAIAELEDLARGRDEVAEAARKQLEPCRGSRAVIHSARSVLITA